MPNATVDICALLERLTSDVSDGGEGDAERRYVCTWVPARDDATLRDLAATLREVCRATVDYRMSPRDPAMAERMVVASRHLFDLLGLNEAATRNPQDGPTR